MHTPLATKLTELTALKAEIDALLPGPLTMFGDCVIDHGDSVGIIVCKLGSRDLEVEAVQAVALSDAKVAVYGVGDNAAVSVLLNGVRCGFHCYELTADEALTILDAARAEKVAA